MGVSLRFKIVLLFAATLVVTMGVAAYLGQRMAAQALETTIRDRAMAVARDVTQELDLSRNSDTAEAADRLVTALARYRGIHKAELAIRRPGNDDVIRVDYGPEGSETTFGQEQYSFPGIAEPPRLVGEGEARRWEANYAVKDPFGQTVAVLRLEAYLSEAENIAAKVRRVFAWLTLASAVVLILASTLILGRLLASPLTALSAAMARVSAEGPEASAGAVPGTERRDEIGTVARGLESMLSRIRGFNRELQEKIDAATADLAAKNRTLAELNDLLVEARRDLTAKERLAALGQLSGTIAHELGNPLNAISGHVQLLARNRELPPGIREEISVIDLEVKRMTGIIRRFLDSARALTPALEPVEVATLVDEALSLTLSAESRARIEVRREVPQDMGRVTLDPSLVRHVLTNFISNAVDAMPQGGRIEVRARRAGEQLALAVADSGPGIGAEQRKRIFEPFYTTKPPGKGTGLGLSICREIAVALKGRIEVESATGQGSTFTLFIPAPAIRAVG
jgi:signal transduction histidine kinase